MALFKFQMEVKLSHTLKDVESSFSMGVWVGRGDEEVIHVDDEPPFSDHISEGIIYESLECSRGVIKAKEHDSGFKESFVGDEGCLPLVTVFNVDIVIPPLNVELSEVACVFQLIYKVGDEGERIDVVSGMFIEVMVVLTGVEFAILLFDKEEGECLEGVGRMDLPSG